MLNLLQYMYGIRKEILDCINISLDFIRFDKCIPGMDNSVDLRSKIILKTETGKSAIDNHFKLLAQTKE